MEGNGVDINDHVVEIQEESIMGGNGVDTNFRNRMEGTGINKNHVLAYKIAVKITNLHYQNLEEGCIHRVVPVFRNGNEEAYTPQVVSIGPFHRGSKNLQAMEHHKLRYLNHFLKRAPKKNIEHFVESLRGFEERARQCYGEPIDLTSDEFVEMMLVDGCFIIEFFLKTGSGETRDTILTSVLMVLNDITDLLENQLPFFILQHLINLVHPELSLLRVSHILISNVFPNPVQTLSPNTESKHQVKHFIDVLRTVYVPTSPKRIPPRTGYELKFIPCASELHASGVKFIGVKFTEDKPGCFLDITFTKNGVFNVPIVVIDDNTNRRFRNLIALEHFDQGARYVSNYTTLMDCLINTPDDVALLRRSGIIDNWLGDDQEVSLLFNKIGKGKIIDSDTFYYARLFEDVNIFYQKRWHKWQATLNRNYFSTPWSIISFSAAFVLLACTIIQAFYAVKKP